MKILTMIYETQIFPYSVNWNINSTVFVEFQQQNLYVGEFWCNMLEKSLTALLSLYKMNSIYRNWDLEIHMK